MTMYKGTRGLRKTPKWEPKKWLAKYDLIVTLRVAGVKEKVVAKQFKMTPCAISHIYMSEQGQKLTAELKAKQFEKLQHNSENKLSGLLDQSISNIERVINDPILINENPFAVFDRSMAVIKGLGKLNADKINSENVGVYNQQNNFFTSPEVGAKILKGLDMVKQAQLLNAGVKDGSTK